MLVYWVQQKRAQGQKGARHRVCSRATVACGTPNSPSVPEVPPGSVNNYSFSHNLITATSCLLTKFLKPLSVTVSQLSALVASPLAVSEGRSHGQGLDSQQRLLCCLLQGAPRQSPLRDSSPERRPEATTRIPWRRRTFGVLLLFLIPDPTIQGCSLMNISSEAQLRGCLGLYCSLANSQLDL